MNILFTMDLVYDPALGGASKANRSIAEQLASRGYSVSAVVPSYRNSERPMEISVGDLGRRQSLPARAVTISTIRGVVIHAVDTTLLPLRKYLAHYLETNALDCAVVSSEDPMQSLLRETAKHGRCSVIYLAHTPNCLPFGPASFLATRYGRALLKQTTAVVAVSNFCAHYIRQWSDIDPVQIYLPVYGEPPFPYYGRFNNAFVTMVNPCAYKGIDILCHLADASPDVKFAAVPSWGTTSNDVNSLRARPNITILEPDPCIDNILRRTRVLLVPSLYLENFPMIIIESMLRGIPVLASHVGGIPEAMAGVGCLIAVKPISQYLNAWNENKLWIPVVPEQDIVPWHDALRRLTKDVSTYTRESLLARDRATAFVTPLTLNPIEMLIRTVVEDRVNRTNRISEI